MKVVIQTRNEEGEIIAIVFYSLYWKPRLVSSFLHLNLSPDAKHFPEALFKTIYIFVGKEAKSDLEVTAEAEAEASRSKGEDRRRFADCCLSRIQGKAGEEKMAAAEVDAKAKGEEARLAIEVEAKGEGRRS